MSYFCGQCPAIHYALVPALKNSIYNPDSLWVFCFTHNFKICLISTYKAQTYKNKKASDFSEAFFSADNRTRTYTPMY